VTNGANTNPHPVPEHLAGITVYIERILGTKIHLTLYQTGPIQLDSKQAVEVLRGALDIAEAQLATGGA
jgi:hypothetical protein